MGAVHAPPLHANMHVWGILHYICTRRFHHSNPKPTDPKTDHRWMLNVTSSASVNVPPPNGLVTAMNKTNHAGKIDSKTKVRRVPPRGKY